MKTKLALCVATAVCVLAVLAFASCGDTPAAGAPGNPAALPAQAPPAATVAAADELATWRRELLELAFDAASAFPLDPHRKNRGRAQQVVVKACFALEQPDLAVAYGGRIADWRRGCAYADYAFRLAARGDAVKAREYITLAEGVAKEEGSQVAAQEWRVDLIALKIARAHAVLGDGDAATKAAAGIDSASANAVDDDWAATAAERARLVAAADVPKELAAIDTAFATMSIGQQHIAMATLARLYERCFADAEVRAFCEERILTQWATVMPALRLDALERLVRICVAHGELGAAKTLLGAMRTIVAGHTWRSEDRLPQQSRLIELTVACGEIERARAEAEQALVAWHTERDGIVDIWRARALRPLALAWHTLGEAEKCQELLALVLEESLENPNSRPRCDDFVDTCTALVSRGIEPSAATWTRLREIRKGLGDPW
jgi:hypothetical protein